MEDSSFGRLAGVLAAPGKTFASIRERPTWLVPLLVFVLLGAGLTWIGMNQVDWADALTRQIEASGQDVPEGQLDGMIDFYEEWGGIVFGLVTAIFTPIGMLLMAGAFFLFLKVLGSELTFLQTFSTSLYAMAPRIVAGLIAVPILMLGGEITQEELQSGAYLASNLAAFAPEDASAVTVALLSSVDFFSIWSLVLLVIGFSVVGRVSRAKAAIATVSLWVVWIVVKIGLASLQGAFGG